MRQKTFSSVRPESPWHIENVKNGKCTILFFDNIEEVQEVGEEQEASTTYKYDLYVMTEVPYRDNLSEELQNNYENWLNDVKEQDRNAVASDIRIKRDYLLSSTDWTQMKDTALSTAEQQKYAIYRQALRDIPQQVGFPYDVVYPVLGE